VFPECQTVVRLMVLQKTVLTRLSGYGEGREEMKYRILCMRYTAHDIVAVNKDEHDM
jgi:hypothetical protein